MAQGIMAQTTQDDLWEIITEDRDIVTVRILDVKNTEDRELMVKMQSFNRGDRERARECIRADLRLTIPKE